MSRSPLAAPVSREDPSPASTSQLRATVITCSDSATAGRTVDTSGPLAAEMLGVLGHDVAPVLLVPDDAEAIARAVGAAISGGSRVVVTTGGTGAGPRDVTPEALRGLGLRELPGLGEAIRAASRRELPAADLSRALGGVLGTAVVLALPGSPGGVRDGLTAVGALLGHAARMAEGGGHADAGRARAGHADAGRARAASGRPAARLAPSTTAAADCVDLAGEPGNDALVTSDPISTAALDAVVSARAAGAVVSFAGVVRDHDAGRAVIDLTYEAHPDAGSVLAEVVAEALARPGVLAAAASHRVGDLAVGDLAFAVAVSAAHRREAFDACAWLVDEAKARLPIWKMQRFADGSVEWVNCP